MAYKHTPTDNPSKTYACDEAIKLVEWLLNGLAPEDALAIEMPFLDVRRKADVMVAGPTRLSAIEIKGPRDNFRRLSAQLEDYQKMFLDVSLAVPEQHLKSARELIPRCVGIILLEPKGASWIRRPRVRQRLRGENAIRWLNRNDLALLVGPSNVRNQGIEQARSLALKLNSEKSLTQLALESIYKRCQQRHALFTKEKGPNVDLDDLKLLALSSNLRVQSKGLPRKVEVDAYRYPK